MKIHIENLTNWRNLLLIAGAVILIFVGFFGIIPGISPAWNMRLLGLGLLLGAWFSLRFFLPETLHRLQREGNVYPDG